MTNEKIDELIQKLRDSIEYSQEAIAALEKTRIEQTDSFEEKFRVWWESESKAEYSSIIDEDDFPKTRAYFDNMDIYRYETVDICDFLGEDLDFLLNPEECVDNIKEDKKEEMLGIAKEIMENNLGSFEWDW